MQKQHMIVIYTRFARQSYYIMNLKRSCENMKVELLLFNILQFLFSSLSFLFCNHFTTILFGLRIAVLLTNHFILITHS